MGGKHKKISERSFFLAPIPDLTEKFSNNLE
jgi:hypothetical protein